MLGARLRSIIADMDDILFGGAFDADPFNPVHRLQRSGAAGGAAGAAGENRPGEREDRLEAGQFVPPADRPVSRVSFDVDQRLTSTQRRDEGQAAAAAARHRDPCQLLITDDGDYLFDRDGHQIASQGGGEEVLRCQLQICVVFCSS